ncbi:MAG: glucose-6-phosphate isomerase [Desulfuromonas sp.]|nr:glucose-6-phosphate isomerase [Desulfuromonas sp.]
MPQSYQDLTATTAFTKLNQFKRVDNLGALLTAERVRSAQVPMAAQLTYNYAAKAVSAQHLELGQQLADEMGVVAQYQRLVAGAVMNASEQRKVLHHLTRGQLGADVEFNGYSVRQFYMQQLQRVEQFCQLVHSGKLRGASGKVFQHVCQIGIGGSDLGPRALYLALVGYAKSRGLQRMQASFISNVDPDDAEQVLSACDLETTLFILVSKSGTTQETLTNEALVRRALEQQGLAVAQHLVAVTSATSPLANNADYLESFLIDDFVGGRYSSTSAVGATVLSLAFGPDLFNELLAGAHAQDRLALAPDIQQNSALLDALIGVYERNCLGYGATAILPYSQALSRFPAHLQQLDMESNGKRVNRRGELLDYATGPLVFGEPGTNGQHSFYQLLHQGSDIVPLQFVGFKQAQGSTDIQIDGSCSQAKLNANLIAQIVAFASGQGSDDPNKVFPGQRPASLIYGESLTPQALGALLAHFENKIMFQGFLWNINSFDQEGVQLGKLLTKQVLSGAITNAALGEYALLLGL